MNKNFFLLVGCFLISITVLACSDKEKNESMEDLLQFFQVEVNGKFQDAAIDIVNACLLYTSDAADE